jgi:Domain of unknown function (DUF4145)
MVVKSGPSTKGHCPRCGGGRNAEVIAHHEDSWQDEEGDIWGRGDYRILKCAGCDQIYFQQETWCSEDADKKTTYWPAPSKRERPKWLWEIDDSALEDLLTSVYTALDNDLRVLAAIGLRTAFDRASELLGVDPRKSFADKLSQLVEDGHIGSTEKASLDVLTDAGSAAAHRGWKPKLKQLDTLSSIMEQFVYRTFVLNAEAKRVKTSIPSRKRP